MKLRQLFFTAFLVGFSGALMPGPLLAVAIGESMRQGAWVGPLLILGHAVLEVSLAVAIIKGLGRFLGLPRVKGLISLAGGAVLLWLAYGMIAAAAAGTSLQQAGGAGSSHLPLPLTGALLSLANPYWTIWWASIGLTYLTRAREIPSYGVPVFMSGHLLADFTWYTAVSFAVSRGSTLFPPGLYRGIILICACFLIAVALWFADAAFGFLGARRPSSLLKERLFPRGGPGQ